MIDRELLSFRRDYYAILAALFRREPGAELLRQLARGVSERSRAARSFHPLLASGWEEIGGFVAGLPDESLAEAVRDEYTQLFIGPHVPEVNPYESFYFTGRLLDRPLAEIRAFLQAIGVEKLEEYCEPEDFIAFELELMGWFIGKQLEARDLERERRFQDLQLEFLRNHLLVWGPTCAQDIQRAKGARFYRSTAKILEGFLALELDLCRERGIGSVPSLAAVRQRYGALPIWKGPTFDAPDIEAVNASSEKKH